MKKLPKIIAVIGPTASGKTRLGVALAREFNGEIISADSRQVYRGMDLGTGKDLEEYGDIPYHLIDVADPNDQFDLKAYQDMAYKAINGVLERDKLPIVVGGSGLYLQAIIDGYVLSSVSSAIKSEEDYSLEAIRAELGETFVSRLNPSEQKNKRRLLRYLEIKKQSDDAQEQLHGTSEPRYETLVIGLDVSIETIREHIKKRLESRFEQGMIEEVERLHDEGVSWERLKAFGLEYKFIARYLQQNIYDDEALEDMKEKLNFASGQFAKRQMTWFKRWAKQGRGIVWIKPSAIKDAETAVKEFISR